jgi:hypothetical protein
MKNYYVESFAVWFVVKCQNKRKAKSIAISEWGGNFIKDIRVATDKEVEHYISLMGERAMEE